MLATELISLGAGRMLTTAIAAPIINIQQRRRHLDDDSIGARQFESKTATRHFLSNSRRRYAHAREYMRTRDQQNDQRGYSDHFQEGAMHNTQTHADAARMGMQARRSTARVTGCAHTLLHSRSLYATMHTLPRPRGAPGAASRDTDGPQQALPMACSCQVLGSGDKGRTWVLRSTHAAGTKSSCGAVQPLSCWKLAIVGAHCAEVRPRRCQKARRGPTRHGAAEQRAIASPPSLDRRTSYLPQRGPLSAQGVRLGCVQGGNIHKCGGAEPCKRM
jgi:hypothetical protein